jgi:hypothetical protein
MSASEKDRPTGNMDEAGNMEYVTRTGQTYFIKPSADQRTTRTKVEEDVIPAIKEYAQDPSLPSAEQMKQFGVDVVEGTYESVKGAIEGTGTMGDVFGVAPAMAVASSVAEVPEGAVRSFGGKSKSGPVTVPRFIMKGENTQYPNPAFGNTKLRDIFEEDKWSEDNFEDLVYDEKTGTFLFEDESKTNLGYAPNLRVHDLAKVALGRSSAEEVLDYIGMDPDLDLVSYVNQRVSDLQERPEFQEYLERYRGLNEEYDPYNLLETSPRTGNQVAVFRSPIPEVLEQLTFPKDGIKGSQLLKEFQDSPSIRGSELKSIGVDINPQRRYTKEDLDNLFSGELWNAAAYLVEQPRYSSYQRQPVLDPTVDYFELIVNADRPTGKNFQALSQHFEDSTLSHARASVKADTWTGQDYVLLEELQSDLLQKGFETKSLPNSDRVYAKYGFDIAPSALAEFVKASDEEITEGLRIAFDINKYGKFNELPEEAKDAFEKFMNNSSEGSYRSYRLATEVLKDYPEYTDASELLTEIRDDLLANPERELPKPPIQKTEEGVRLAFDGLLAEAANRGINRIVIPPFERIVAERFRPGSDDYFKALQPSSGFYATYKKALDKVLSEYEQEFGRENFSTRLVDLDYEPVAYVDKRDPDNRKTVELPSTATEVFFKGAVDKGYDFTAPKFAKGGFVQNYNQGGSVSMDKQMSFFQRGGLLDDGQNVDPISGNEVPPGSLAEEVRDDVDAKLSEGEYVVPADVVRYYGVAYFEKLRNKAKAGLEDMEENGRIGGEPAMDSVEDDLPFSDEELMFEEDGAPVEMAQGGFIAGNPGGFAPGSLGVTGSGGLGGGGTEVKTFINAAGEQRSFIFINGKPIQQIPAGFVEATEENRLKFAQDQTPEAIPTGEVTVPGTGGGDSPGMGEGTDTSGGSSGGRGFNVDDPLGAAQDALEGKGSGIVGGLVGGLLGSVVGLPQMGSQIGKGLGGLSSLSNAAANAEVASILGYDTTSIDKALADAAKSDAAKNAVQNSRGKTNQNFYNAMLGVDAPIAFDRSSFQTDAAYSAAKDSLATAAEKADGLAPGSAVAMGQGLGDSSAGFEADFGEAQAHAEASPTGVTTGSPLGLDQAFGPGGPSDSGGGGGGGDGGTVICTALYNLGLLDKEVYALDAEYGQRIFTLDPAIIVGYHSWAKPIASHIQKDTFTAKLLRSIVSPLGQAWAKEMAHQMRPEKYKTDFLGKMLMKIGYPICKGIGNLKQGQTYAT